jgi:hypothetical protein
MKNIAAQNTKKMERRMNRMKIDLRTIKVWVAKWERSNGISKTASQLAAVMLSKALEENEKRTARVENLMKDITKESSILQKLEQQLLSLCRSKRGREPGIEGEIKEHRLRMAAILKEADEVMKVPEGDHSILVGGLLLEINK